MNKTIEQVEKEANAKIPREAVSTRSGGGGKELSYLESHYVIARMNEVFGVMGWDSETVELRLVEGFYTQKKGQEIIKVPCPAYIAKVRVAAVVRTDDGGYMKVVKEGYGFGSDKSGLNPHEMAVKEAESDAFKRAARQFGMSLGLALYDKTQENVENTPQPKAAATRAPTASKAGAAGTTAPATSSREILLKSITETSKVVVALKKKTADELRTLVKEKFNVDNKEALNDNQAKELLTTLEAIANG
jgi:DNA recombination protein Rad52